MKHFLIRVISLYLIIAPSSLYPADQSDQKPTIRQIDSLDNLTQIYRHTHPQKFKLHSMKALQLSREISYANGEIKALKNLLNVYFFYHQYDSAFTCLSRIAEFNLSLKDTVKIIDTYIWIAEFFVEIDEFPVAENYLHQAYEVAQHFKNSNMEARVLLGEAGLLLKKGQYEMTIQRLYLSLYFFNKTNDYIKVARVYKLLGDSYVELNEFSKAVYFYQQSLKNYVSVDDLSEQAIVETRIAHVYQQMGKLHESLAHNFIALKYRVEVGQRDFIASSLFNVGMSYWLLQNRDSAKVFFDKSLIFAESQKYYYLLASVYKNLSQVSYDDANYRNAFFFARKANEAKRQLILEKATKEVSLKEANRAIKKELERNELINKEIEIQQLQFTNRLIKIVVFEVIFISMVFMSLGVLVFIRRQRRKKQKLSNINYRLMNEIRERKEVADRLHQSEELHRFLAENTIDVISMLDKNLRRIYVSPLCVKLFGYTAGEMCGFETPLQLVHPNDRHLVNQSLVGMLEQKKAISYSYKAIRKDGSFFWAEKSVNPVIDDRTGEISEIITVIRDISDLKVHEEEIAQNAKKKEQLLHEIHNRVKNNFSILVSLMSMQRETSEDSVLNNSLADLQLRIRTMSLVHEHLFNTQQISEVSFDDYLLRLAFVISGSYNNDRIRLKTSIHHCVVPIEMALPLGLIVNELMTNAYKYAFPGDRSGLVKIRLAPAGSQQFCLTVSDDGIGLPDGFTLNDAATMGSQIISLLVEQIEARLEIKSDEETSFNITFSTERNN